MTGNTDSKTQRAVRIGCAAGFWGDTETAAPQLLAGGRLDYLVFDYLAEITMSIMAGHRLRRPDGGHAHDFVTRVMRQCLPAVMEQGVKVVTNAGGVNPLASREALRALAGSMGLEPRIAVVLGDDLMPELEALRAAGVREMYLDSELPETVVTMNAYLGARPIAAALAAGADFVITGRVADSALVLGPLLHEHGWSIEDYDRLAQGSLAGHIVECGAQATGGLLTDWELVGDYSDLGFPIAVCEADGSFVIEKPPNTGGRVVVSGVLEQLLYEIGDPRAYLLPDVVCDFTEVVAEEVGPDQVRVRGARGRPPPTQYKVSATYPDGFKTSAGFLLAGENAVEKAEAVGKALLHKTEKLLRTRGFAGFRDSRIDVLGGEVVYGAHSRARQSREVVLRLSVSHDDGDALKLMLRELPQMGTGGAPGFASGVGGRSGAMAVIRLFSFLVERERVHVRVDLDGESIALPPSPPPAFFDAASLAPQALDYPDFDSEFRVPLIALATGRSGDKGDHSNIGILARDPSYVPYIGAALTETAVARHMAHVLDNPRSKVTRWALPGSSSWNFLLEHSLGGGGVASLRPDPQGKTFAQQLLAMEIPVPQELCERLTKSESP
ncbi:MAG: DUF1446 domain-containing protein [Myxococcales bacterium]|nr:DUF1446 domain-containing protein [Myxococcales bacterium]